MMILGAATHGLQLQRFIDTVPIRVARDAPCTVILVKQQLPFDALGQRPRGGCRKRDNHAMTAPHTDDTLHPYASLTPDLAFDALASVGLYGDGRLMALGSYENRVYQATLEDGSRVVAKFYRPGRWSEAQILEEHAFPGAGRCRGARGRAPAAARPQPAPACGLRLCRQSLARRARTPELDDFEVLEWLGRYLARIHKRGRSPVSRSARRWTCRR